MAVSIRNMFVGILLFSSVLLGMLSFANEWVSSQNMAVDPQLKIIEGNMNTSLETMYEESKTHSNTLEKSSVYTDESSKDVISLSPYKVVSGTFGLTKSVLMNTTTETMRLGILPGWIFELTVAVFLLTIVFLAAAAYWKVNQV